MSEQAILHLTPDGGTLLGAWVNHGGTQLRHYSEASADEGAEAYGEAVLADRTWDELTERLPATSAFLAWWELYPRQANESAESVFARAKEEHGLS